MAAMGTLTTIAKQRPQFMSSVVEAFEMLHGKIYSTGFHQLSTSHAWFKTVDICLCCTCMLQTFAKNQFRCIKISLREKWPLFPCNRQSAYSSYLVNVRLSTMLNLFVREYFNRNNSAAFCVLVKWLI